MIGYVIFGLYIILTIISLCVLPRNSHRIEISEGRRVALFFFRVGVFICFIPIASTIFTFMTWGVDSPSAYENKKTVFNPSPQKEIITPIDNRFEILDL